MAFFGGGGGGGMMTSSWVVLSNTEFILNHDNIYIYMFILFKI